MIVVCTCTQKSRVKNLSHADRIRCAKCAKMLGPLINKQAERNSGALLDIAARLYAKPEATWTKEEDAIARIIAFHVEANK